MAMDYEETYAKHLEWNRDTNGRLYYVLWVLFLGGFVFTFQMHRAANCYQFLGVFLFRVLAIVGCVINFLYQENAINSVGELRQQLRKEDSARWMQSAAEKSKGQVPEEEYARALRLADEEKSQANKHKLTLTSQDRTNKVLRVLLLASTAVYLAAALLLSFAYYPI